MWLSPRCVERYYASVSILSCRLDKTWLISVRLEKFLRLCPIGVDLYLLSVDQHWLLWLIVSFIYLVSPNISRVVLHPLPSLTNCLGFVSDFLGSIPFLSFHSFNILRNLNIQLLDMSVQSFELPIHIEVYKLFLLSFSDLFQRNKVLSAKP